MTEHDRRDYIRRKLAELLIEQRIPAGIFERCWHDDELAEFVVQHERKHDEMRSMLVDNLVAWDGEEQSVREENSVLIGRLRWLVDQLAVTH
jgi:hypothetical protein